MVVFRFALTVPFILAAAQVLRADDVEQLPAITHTAKLQSSGAVEYRWNISSTFGGDAVTSVVEMSRRFGQANLTFASDYVSWSRKTEKWNREVLVNVSAPTKNRIGRTIQVKRPGGTGTYKLSPNAIVTITQREHIDDTKAVRFSVIDIRVTDDDQEVIRYVVLARPAKLNDYPKLVAKIREFPKSSADKKVSAVLNSLTHVEDVKDLQKFAKPFLR